MLRSLISVNPPINGTTVAMIVSDFNLTVYDGFVSAAVVVDPEL